MTRWLTSGWTLLAALALLALLNHQWVEAGKGVGEDAAYAREMGFEQHFFYGTSGGANEQIEYICRAFPGMTSNDDLTASVWQVQRFTYNASGQLTDIEFAGDDDAFNQACSARTSLNYD